MLAPALSTTVDRLLREIDHAGIAASADELAALARHARTHGVSVAVIDVLLDETAPAIVRERAAARVAMDVVAASPSTPLAA